MEFSEPLSLHLSALAMGVPITLPQLEKLIDLLPQNHSAVNHNSLLRVLLINERAYGQKQQSSYFDTFGQLLKILVSKVKLNEPLRSLASCNFDAFHKYCSLSQDKQLQKVGQVAFGLFPVSIPGDNMPRSIYHQKIQGVISGNPQWIYSRATLNQYSLIRNTKIPQHAKEIYLFLLSSHELLDVWKSESFKQFWGELYLYYNKLAFEPYIEDTPHLWITWNRSFLNEITNRLKIFEFLLSNDEKLLYYLALDILGKDADFRLLFEYNPFEAAFIHFTKNIEESNQWQYIMALLYFKQISQARGLTGISQACVQKFQKLLRDPYSLQKATLFIHFFLSDEQICQLVLDNRLDYWRIPMSEERKKIVANFLLINGVFYNKSLKYIERNIFVENAFKSAALNQVETGPSLLDSLQACENEISIYFKDFFSQFSRQEFLYNFRLFIRTWRSYYKLLQFNNLQEAQTGLLEPSYFHKSLQSIFYIPRQNIDLVFNVLIKLARYYRGKDGQAGDIQNSKEKIEDFQQSTLPSLLLILNEQQRIYFQKEWNETQRQSHETYDETMNVTT